MVNLLVLPRGMMGENLRLFKCKINEFSCFSYYLYYFIGSRTGSARTFVSVGLLQVLLWPCYFLLGAFLYLRTLVVFDSLTPNIFHWQCFKFCLMFHTRRGYGNLTFKFSLLNKDRLPF